MVIPNQSSPLTLPVMLLPGDERWHRRPRARPRRSSSCSSPWPASSPMARTAATRPASPSRSTPARSAHSTTPARHISTSTSLSAHLKK